MMNTSGGAAGVAPTGGQTLSLRSFLLSPLDPATWRAALAVLIGLALGVIAMTVPLSLASGKGQISFAIDNL